VEGRYRTEQHLPHSVFPLPSLLSIGVNHTENQPNQIRRQIHQRHAEAQFMVPYMGDNSYLRTYDLDGPVRNVFDV